VPYTANTTSQAGPTALWTGFAFPEVLQALVRARNAGQHERVHNIYQRFLPLIVFEQQPGVAVRKEIFRLRGLAQSNQVRHPAASIGADTAVQLQAVLQTTLPDIDITQPISI